jgi:hypothetical protein
VDSLLTRLVYVFLVPVRRCRLPRRRHLSQNLVEAQLKLRIQIEEELIGLAKATTGAISTEAVVELALRELALRVQMSEGYIAEAANPSLDAAWFEVDLDGIC